MKKACRNNLVEADNGKQSLFDNPLWSIKQAALKLSVSEKTLRDWVYKRKVPFVKVGNLVRFIPSEIEEWIQERSVSYAHRED